MFQRVLIVSFACAVLLGCAPKRFYEGRERPRSEVAVLREPDDPEIRAWKIDGITAAAENELLPGRHRIGILSSGEDAHGYEWTFRCYSTLAFEAGREYVIDARRKASGQHRLSKRGLGRAVEWRAVPRVQASGSGSRNATATRVTKRLAATMWSANRRELQRRASASGARRPRAA